MLRAKHNRTDKWPSWDDHRTNNEECNAPCNGDRDQTCGGGNLMNIFTYYSDETPPTSLNTTSPHITCKTAGGQPQVPCTSEFDSCCDGISGVGQSCYASGTQDCCTSGPGKGHVCPKGKCSTRAGFFCD